LYGPRTNTIPNERYRTAVEPVAFGSTFSQRRVRIASIALSTFAIDDWISVRLSQNGFPESNVIAIAIDSEFDCNKEANRLSTEIRSSIEVDLHLACADLAFSNARSQSSWFAQSPCQVMERLTGLIRV
jgi:hypothetical protein